MKALHYSCQGESHKATNKVCQDYSYSEVNEHMTIAIVCDGHGGARYFRSDVGAKYATEITKECVATFIDGIAPDLFNNKEFTQVEALNTEIINENFAKKTKVDVAMRQLFSSIIYRWQEMILNHAYNNPLTDAERAILDSRYVSDFEAKVSLEKTYGCTLMCFAQTENYWFAFHLGDGKCIAFDKNGKWSEPIPWDDRCFLNKTTSLCDSSALDEFRYCYQGNGEFPVAVFLGSDGIDDSFGETTNMVNFYAQVAKMLAKDSFEESMNSIKITLPELSAKGSKDDMSVACVYDDTRLSEMVNNIIAWQQSNAHQAITATNQRLELLLDKYNKFEGKKLFSRSEQIDLRYTVSELKRAYQYKREQAKKYDRFSQELGGDFEPYNDEYGFGEQLVLIAEKKLEEQIAEEVPETQKSVESTNSEGNEVNCKEVHKAEDESLESETTVETTLTKENEEDVNLQNVGLEPIKSESVESSDINTQKLESTAVKVENTVTYQVDGSFDEIVSDTESSFNDKLSDTEIINEKEYDK